MEEEAKMIPGGDAGEQEEEILAQKQLAEFNEFLHSARALFNSDPTRVSNYFTDWLLCVKQTRSKIKFRNETGLIVIKVTNERTTHRFLITKENMDQGPRFIADFNHLMVQLSSNATERKQDS